MSRPLPTLRSADASEDGRPRREPAPWEQERSGIVSQPSLPNGLRFAGTLGRGATGVVVAAIEESSGALVAVKMLDPRFAQDAEQRTRLLREAAAASRLTSPHATKVLDAGEFGDGALNVPYVVMEYLEGRPLDQILRAGGPLDVRSALELTLQALDAVAEAHAIGLVHRDLKPSNLFVVDGDDGAPFVKVLDFGLVRDVLSTKSNARLTAGGALMGTPGYMAPEQLAGRLDLDARCDVWAMGVTLYELLAGEVPFGGLSIIQIMTRAMGDPMPSLCERRPDVSPRLERMIARALSKRPDDRFVSGAELAAALGAELF